MHRSSPPPAFLRNLKRTVLGLAVASAFAPAALANPVGPTVVSGSASFSAAGNVLNVTNAPGTIINWQQFNIGQNEITKFIQQNAQSTVLNRIGGQDPSQILGTLQSNGRVFLVNPNGILFGHNAVIDVAGLVASNLNLGNADFLAGRFSFSGGGVGAVINQGTITTPVGGSVYLVGSQVGNEGLITSPQGAVLLAAGNSVSLADTGTPSMSVTLTAGANQAVNLGRIDAAGGHIDIYAALIDQQGVLRADSASVDAQGRVVLKATGSATVSGEIGATNSAGTGGIVQVLGDAVTLTGSARIDVSGSSGGGAALIGGDYQGKNAAVQNATTTTIAAGATIKADALEAGNGGKVIVWADDKTFYDGFISARGGANGGDGGFVETSGHNSLAVTGFVTTLAPRGKAGQWLLDPASYCVYITSSTECSPLFMTATSSIQASGLDSMLSGGNVTISATDYLAYAPAGGQYLVGAGFSGRTLSFEAPYLYSNGELNTVANSSALSIAFRATGTSASFASRSGWVVADAGGRALTMGGGTISVEASAKIAMVGGAQLSTTTTGGKVFLSAPLIDNAGGTVTSARAYYRTDSFFGSANTVVPGELDVSPYTDGRTVYLGVVNTDPRCSTALCITQQFASGSSIGDELFIFTQGDLNVESGTPGFGHGASRLMLAARNNLTLNDVVSAPGRSDKPLTIGLYGGSRFVNNVGAGAVSVGGFGRWGIITGSASTATFNGLSGTETSVVDPWPSNLNTQSFETYTWVDEAKFNAVAASSNAIGYFSSSSAATTQVVDQQVAQQTASTTAVTTTQTPTTTPTIAAPTATVTYENALSSSTASTAPVALTTPTATTAQNGTAATSTAAAPTSPAAAAAKVQERREQHAAEKAAEARKSEGELKAEARQVRAESRKAEAEAKKVETEAKKAEAEAKKADADAKKAESAATTPAKKAEVAAKKAEAESKKAEAESKKQEAESKKAEAESKKAEAESKETVAEAKRARGDKKAELADKAEEKRVESVQKKAEADVKKARSEEKKLEAEAHKADSEGRKGEAQAKRVEAERRAETRKAEAVKAFTAVAVAQAGDQARAMLAAMRHDYKTEIFQPALKILEANPQAADLPACGAGASDVCISTPAQVRQEVQQAARQQAAQQPGVPQAAARPAATVQLPAPTVSFLPQIQRKIAVMIGVNDYADKAIPPLESAVPDAEAVGNLLKGQLGYEVRVVKNASKADIVKSLGNLAKEIGPNDSVTIYYAGHGYQSKGAGYWIPADASVKNPANWVSNSDVSKLMGNIPAKQVMLVSDSCYSGAFTKEQKVGDVAADAQAILNRRSVVVMSSGGEEPVSDEGREGHSIFAWNLMNSLKGVDKFETGSKVFNGIKRGVTEEFPQVPQYGAATSAGHSAGGDYLFEVRSYR